MHLLCCTDLSVILDLYYFFASEVFFVLAFDSTDVYIYSPANQ